MFRQEFNFLIQRVNGEVVPIVSKEKIQILIEVLIYIYVLTLTIIPIFVYDIAIAICKMFWGLFTPGQQWLEILLIVGGIGFMVLCKCITDEFTEKIVKKIVYLKEQNIENVKKITELEEEKAALKKKIEDEDKNKEEQELVVL